MQTKIKDTANELDAATYKVEEAETLLGILFENYFDRTQDFIDKQEGARRYFVSNYGRIQKMMYLAINILGGAVEDYRELSGEIMELNKGLRNALEPKDKI